MYDAVHLTESRCDGSAHGGCQNACSLYWKEQWLKRVDPDDPAPPTPDAGQRALLPLLVAEDQKEPFEDGEPRYSCQGTEMDGRRRSGCPSRTSASSRRTSRPATPASGRWSRRS